MEGKAKVALTFALYQGDQLVRRDFQKPLDGVTGRITLEGPHTFGRALAPAEVDGGRVIPLRSAP